MKLGIQELQTKKVGILTLHDSINHGSFLQAYCLQEIIKAMGHDVYIINYKAREHAQRENRIFWGKAKEYIKFNSLRKRLNNIGKIFKFKKNHKQYYTLTKFSHNIKEIFQKNNFDVVVLGSDEIWNFKNPLFKLDLAYFGKGIRAKKIISYAPSFGQVNLNDEIPIEIKNCLKQISHISGRDNNTLKIIESLGFLAQKVIDPTFLYDLTSQIKNPPKGLSNYILVYVNHIKSDDIIKIKKYANKSNKKLVGLSYERKWCDQNFIVVDPFEWLGFFKFADSIITNTFHGTVYSIINGKNFCVLNPAKKSNKIHDILQEFALLKHKTYEGKAVENILEIKLDTKNTLQKIKNKKIDSLNYLSNAIL
ncbi:MAG: polysaccharide pyruvyl transferase family protein [Xenococcaceae cyanobacterium MO_188.B32]|nr:polysaccharide pyruvyl transferase family protein [Xenococcaceae cyanobacterium MO_188.B32]